MIEQWKAAAKQQTDERMRSTYAGLALVFAQLAGRERVWRQALKGWNMRESAIANEWRAEGRVEGHTRAQQRDLLRILELRFQKKLPMDVVAAVEAQSDTDKLAAWLDAAITSASPDEFRTAM